MGRVYDALKRAESAQRSTTTSKPSVSRDGNVYEFASPAKGKGHEHPWEGSAFTAMPAVISSASTAHTEEATGGPALPGGSAFRDAGATLGAVGSTRAAEFSSREILAARVEPHLVAITQPQSPECEQFRSLRTRMLQAGERRNMRAFVITSAGRSEGKTLTSLNLAWLLAQTDGVKALVIDADLRQPCTAEYLGIESEVGLSEVLTGTTKLSQAILKLEPSGLHLLPGGMPREDVAELLSGPRFGRLLDEARKFFDYIIIDAPPLGVFTDANLLINRADAAMLVVRASKTRFSAVDRLLEHLPRERMLGVILNRAESQPDETALYYQQRYQQAMADNEADEVAGPDDDAEDQLKMIYIEEDVVS
ncbi:MAG TPA: CpsD/CapB family tyrosine-protein kinase [Pyrinomonadaceae bacterium]|nr:CpsD/CapB family tyrosine-protein kinase [Pyrinomonadaceae bacterium]